MEEKCTLAPKTRAIKLRLVTRMYTHRKHFKVPLVFEVLLDED